MAYFKIGGTDFSMYVNELKITKDYVYKSQTNAAGDTVVDMSSINAKRTIEVGIIPLEDEAMKSLEDAISSFYVTLSFRNPKTGALEENVKCIIPSESVEYYTIQINKVSYKAFSLEFYEL